MRGKCPNTEFFLVRIFLYSDWIRTRKNSVFGHFLRSEFFADDTSLFPVTHNITDSANPLNYDLSKINEWALQWKMSFNPDPTKQAQEIFSRKSSKRNHLGLMFNNNIVNLTTIHKRLGMIFDSKLSFDEHLKSVLLPKPLSRVRFRVAKIQKMAQKLFLFYKIYKKKSLSYFYNLIPDRVKFYSTRSSQINNISNIKTRSNFLRNSFFPSTVTEWNKLDPDIRNSDSLNVLSCLF